MRPLAIVLAGLVDAQTTGTLSLAHGDRVATVTMRDGKVTRVWSSEPELYLGGVVYELGLIDDITLNETLREVATEKKLHGEVLVARGAITPAELDQALVEQTYRKLHRLFDFPEETRWSFAPLVQRARDDGRPPVDPWRAIWHGLREHPPVVHVKRTLARIEGSLTLNDEAGIVPRLGLTAEEHAVIELLARGPIAVPALVASAHQLPQGRVESLVYILALARSVARVNVEASSPTSLGREGIMLRAKTILEEDPYAVLGLPEGASPEAARAAYFRLARHWQRERIPEHLADLGPECELVFATICDAHRILTTPELRPRAHTTIAQAIRDSIAPPPTTISFAEIDRALERDDFATAASLAQTLTLTGAQGPSARAVLVWCETHGARAPEEVLEAALLTLDKVLSGDPECARAAYYRGRIYKRLGQPDAAARDFRKVTRIDPRHVDALREVRLFEMRGTPARDCASMEAAGSGLRRLFDRALAKT